MQKELKRLQKANPKEKFRIAYCKKAREKVIQVLELNKNWLCLHN